MSKTLDKIISANHQFKIGLYFGIALVLIALANNFKIGFIEINSPFNWLFVFLFGMGVFFFFMGIALNTEENCYIKEEPNGKGGINRNTQTFFNTHLHKFNILSKACFWFSGISFLLSIIKLGFIIWK